ncbi:protein NLRC3-like protein [Lates japonicus]|uniref:Protein NLRC3-like protein n=1 Tax=Lates japonicus TaxID=270547 RepID=A0AAD3N2Y8_LATJO|nr:protein NLRC3-like protein [Lates japonicus]
MNQCEDREEGVPPSKTTLCGEHESQTKAQSPEQQDTPDSAGPEPEPSCVSMKSNRSITPPLNFRQSADGRTQQQRPDSPEPSCLSFKSDLSKDLFIGFKGQRPSADQK